MKRLALVSLLTTAALGAHAHSYFDDARVSSVEPQYESVSVPRQECGSRWIEDSRRPAGRNYGGAVVGGVAGALLGNQFGRGHGREAATAVGAVVGAFTGDNVANRGRWQHDEPVAREVTSCRTVSDVQQRIVGYQVGYEYRGQHFVTRMAETPGPTIQVRVTVDPVGR